MEAVGLGLELLLLLTVANGAPVMATHLMKGYANWPIDGGCRGPDRRRLLGASKTWRGVFAAVVATAAVAFLLGHSIADGALFGLFAMLGDMFSSFIKRRMGMASSARAFGLDQVPEALLPLWLMHEQFGIGWLLGSTTVFAFVFIGMGLSKLLYRLHIRKQPY